MHEYPHFISILVSRLVNLFCIGKYSTCTLLLPLIKPNTCHEAFNYVDKSVESELRAYLVVLFKQQFSLFKQHNTYFHNIFLSTHISITLKQCYQMPNSHD